MRKVKVYILFQRLLSISYLTIFLLGIVFLMYKLSVFFRLNHYLTYYGIGLLSVFIFWKINRIISANWAKKILHEKNKSLEYSLDLATSKSINWIQQQQINQVEKQVIHLSLKPNLVFAILGITTLLLASFIRVKPILKSIKSSEYLSSKPIKIPLKFGKITLHVSPPSYTGLAASYSDKLDIIAPQNSDVHWQIEDLNQPDLKYFISLAKGLKQEFKKKKEFFTFHDKFVASGLYTIQAYTKKDSLVYQSPFYSLQVIEDQPPNIAPSQKELFSTYSQNSKTSLNLNANIKDDYAVQKVQIIATLARGNGENVKFREKIINVSSSSFKEKNIEYILDIKTLNFEPGDELFYYWLAIDNKWPEPHITKSDTYFLKYTNPKEEKNDDASTMAMLTLPEYFRSQRQIIIDTEKLIKKRNKIKKQLFDEESNNIGFDQKSLRIRYGQYLGEEFETNLGHAHEEENPLASFTHDHDTGEHEDEQTHESPHAESQTNTSTESDPLAALMEQYVHSHDDGEMNTFFEQSTRSLLKMALEQMWQSELHLRLYEPEKALPFENKALGYLKEAQQKARSYVKKSGFDPTPIKEKEKRLTGKLEKTNPKLNFVRFLAQEELKYLSSYALGILNKATLTQIEKQNLANLIQILPAKYNIKADLQRLLNGNKISEESKNKIRNSLLSFSSFQKTNNALPQFADKNENLRNEFLNQLRK